MNASFTDAEFRAQYDLAILERREQEKRQEYDTTAQNPVSELSLQHESPSQMSVADSTIPVTKPKRRRGKRPPEHRSTHRPVGPCDVFGRTLPRRARFARLRLLEQVTDHLASA